MWSDLMALPSIIMFMISTFILDFYGKLNRRTMSGLTHNVNKTGLEVFLRSWPFKIEIERQEPSVLLNVHALCHFFSWVIMAKRSKCCHYASSESQPVDAPLALLFLRRSLQRWTSTECEEEETFTGGKLCSKRCREF